jgi:hypothetical protein
MNMALSRNFICNIPKKFMTLIFLYYHNIRNIPARIKYYDKELDMDIIEIDTAPVQNYYVKLDVKDIDKKKLKKFKLLDSTAFLNLLNDNRQMYLLQKLYMGRKHPFFRLKKFIYINKRRPYKNENDLYIYLKDMVEKYRNSLMTDEEIEGFENIKWWKWEYSDLIPKNIKFIGLIEKLKKMDKIDKKLLEPSDIKLYKKLKSLVERNKIDQYIKSMFILATIGK